MLQYSVSHRMTRSEREVAWFLDELGIAWSYEQPLFVWDDNRRPRVWAPDFLLKPFDVYVEVCGSEDFNYEYRQSIYHLNGYKVMFLHLYKNANTWKKFLIDYLQQVHSQRNIVLRESFKSRYNSCLGSKVNY